MGDFVASFGTSADMTLLGICITACILYGLWRGTGLLTSLTLALPIAAFLYLIFPYHAELTHIGDIGIGASLIFFIVLLIAVLWILARTTGIASGDSRPLHVVIVAVALSLVVFSFLQHVVPIDDFYTFSDTFVSIFGSATNAFWIVSIALLALFVV